MAAAAAAAAAATTQKQLFSLVEKSGIPTLMDQSALKLARFILSAAAGTKKATPPPSSEAAETSTVRSWSPEELSKVQRYLSMPWVCMQKLGTAAIFLSTRNNLNSDQLFLIWWLRTSSSDSLVLPQLQADKAKEFNIKMLHYLSSEPMLQLRSLAFTQNFSYANLASILLKKHSNLKSLTLACPINKGLLKVLPLYCGRNLQELSFVKTQDRPPQIWTNSSNDNSLLSLLLLRVSDTLTSLCLSGADFLPTVFGKMLPALRKCSKLKKLSLPARALVKDQWGEEECLPTVSHLTVSVVVKGLETKYVLAAITKVFPNVIHLNLQGVLILDTEYLALLQSVGHCLKEMTCTFYEGIHLSQILNCCHKAKKLTLFQREIGQQQQQRGNTEEDFSLPFLQDVKLKSSSIQHSDLIRILKTSPELKSFSLWVQNIADFKQFQFVEMVESGRNVLRHLETFEIMEGVAMSERLMLSLLTLPNIKKIGYASANLLEDVEVKKKLLAVVKANGMKIQSVVSNISV